jgi:subtilisin
LSLAADLRKAGVAQVIVILKPDALSKVSKVKRHFQRSPFSRDVALLEALRDRGHIMSARAAAGRIAVDSLGAVSSAPTSRFYPNLGILFGTVDQAGLASLRNEDAVAKVLPAPDLRMIRPVSVAAAAPKRGLTWGLKRLGVLELWKKGLTGKGVLVGHLDTGIDGAHPALKGAIGVFAEFDSLGNAVPGAKPKDSDEHGTHTAGTIAGRRVGKVSFGVAPGAKLASAMVIEGGNVIARILAGMDWAVGHKVRVLNMSLGLQGTDDTFRPLTAIIRARGILPVFAIGNEGPGTSRYPGNYPEALSVGAMDENDAVADFSSSQRFARAKQPLVPDLVGPGVEVLSCTPSKSYSIMSGTSMATPHIAGLAALLLEAVPNATVSKLESAIFSSCKRPASMPKNRANRGVPYGPAALDKLNAA